MFWVGLIVAMVIISAFLESDVGKLLSVCGVVALGLLILKWITGWGIFISIAKICAVIIVVAVMVLLVVGIFGI